MAFFSTSIDSSVLPWPWTELFVQALRLCRKAGLVNLGHISLDGTKIRAKAESTDQDEDARWGKDRYSDELPEELRFQQSRPLRIKQAYQHSVSNRFHRSW
jgi:hypothetical protein